MFKLKITWWVVHVARMGGEVHMECLWGNLGGIDNLEDLGVDGSILLNWFFKK